MGSEFREKLGIGHDLNQVAQVQPLAGEIIDQGIGLGILQHPSNLLIKHIGLVKFAICRELEQFIIRHSAPKKIGKARGKFEIRKLVLSFGIIGMGIHFHPEQKMRRNQHRLETDLNAPLEGFPLLGYGFNEGSKAIDFPIADRASKGTGQETGKNLPSGLQNWLFIVGSGNNNLLVRRW